MDILLKLRHWVLFAVMMIPPIIADVGDLAGFWYSVSVIWTALIYTCWLFSIGNAVYSVGSTSRFAIVLFKAGVIYLIICLLSVFYNTSHASDFFPLWQIVLYCVGIFVEFYLFFFVAKNLVYYENDHHLESKSIFLTFCAIWFFPIGVFFVQPRINQIVSVSRKSVLF